MRGFDSLTFRQRFVMPSVEEMSAWTEEETRAAIHVLLPEGWHFNLLRREGMLVAQFLGPDGGEIWARAEPDRKILLLNAYGWLWSRGKSPEHPMWRSRTKLTRVPVHRVGLPGVEVPDPEDLDPEEVVSVYARRGNF